jgi:hypothetical protein
MRIGTNPMKEKPALEAHGLHRLIIPVYIPHQEGYFKESLPILKLCLDSVRLTKAPETAVTVIANGCCEAVTHVLIEEGRRGWIDHVVLHAKNRGKVDAIIGAARGCFEEVVTFADCDVLFRPGWDVAIETIFRVFPECGFVCPFPNADWEGSATSSVFLANVWRTTFQPPASQIDLDHFRMGLYAAKGASASKALGNLTVQRSGLTACIGGGHFVCSLRRPVIRAMPPEPSLQAITGGSEGRWLDHAPDRLGYWKLSTARAYVQHMGNHLEPWMYEEYQTLASGPAPAPEMPAPLSPMRVHWTASLPYAFRKKLGRRWGRHLRDRYRARSQG